MFKLRLHGARWSRRGTSRADADPSRLQLTSSRSASIAGGKDRALGGRPAKGLRQAEVRGEGEIYPSPNVCNITRAQSVMSYYRGTSSAYAPGAIVEAVRYGVKPLKNTQGQPCSVCSRHTTATKDMLQMYSGSVKLSFWIESASNTAPHAIAIVYRSICKQSRFSRSSEHASFEYTYRKVLGYAAEPK